MLVGIGGRKVSRSHAEIKMWNPSDERDDNSERRRAHADLAALRFETALVRYELKYRTDQAREPAGQPIGGRFAKENNPSSATRTAGTRGFLTPPVAAAAARAVAGTASHVAPFVGAGDVAAVAGPVAATGMLVEKIGEMGASQVIGRFNRGPNGPGGLTPFSHFEMPSLTPTMPALTMLRDTGAGREPVPKGQFDDECEEQQAKDEVVCMTNAAMYGRTPKARREIIGVCFQQARQRYSECLRDGVGAIRSPLYDGRSFPPKKKRKS